MQAGSRIPRSSRLAAWACLLLLVTTRALGGDLIVRLPPQATAQSAAALAPSTQPAEEGAAVEGTVHAGAVFFNGLVAGTPYDVKITLDSGVILHGVNMGWYTSEPPKPGAAALGDDDRRQIAALVGDVKSFYDVSRVITLSGDQNRATVLVERIRSTDFDGDLGGEVIWRVELWYFVNDFGGWSELPQTNKVLIRRRFRSDADYRAAVDRLRWTPCLGGIMLRDADEKRRIVVPADAIANNPR